MGETNNLIQDGKWSFLQYRTEGSEKLNDTASVDVADDGAVTFINTRNEKCTFRFDRVILPPEENKDKYQGLYITTKGKADKGTGFLRLNHIDIPLNGTAWVPCSSRSKLRFTFELGANSTATLSECIVRWCVDELSLADQCSRDTEVLVIAPSYPSPSNLYLSAFVHSRNRAYIEKGLSVQTVVISTRRNNQVSYEYDGVPVLMAGPAALKELIQRKQYKTLIVHFADCGHYRIFDGYITNEELVFVCHGPETTFPLLGNVSRPYFCDPIEDEILDKQKLEYVKKYARKDNVSWVFVSQWELEASESCLGIEFKNKCVIPNIINEELFPFKRKNADDRKNILVIRRFDNNRYHSVDIVYRCILELSRRSFFKDLHFEIVGDGSLLPQFAESLQDFSNVEIKKGYVPNSEISFVHERNGILLIPSRHDSQGVSMCEGASSGLVVVGSDVCGNASLMRNDLNHTMVDPEDASALADVIERLYFSPEEYLEISERMSKSIRATCGVDMTVVKEIGLIEERLQVANDNWGRMLSVSSSGDPVLSVIVPAYNLEDFISKCLYSLLNHRNAGKMEILVVNDGSKDNTVEVASEFEKMSPGVVRVIDKPNGGHGSTINRGIAEAKGRYLRIVDGDDWVISENLADQIDILESVDVDVVLTGGKHEYINRFEMAEIFDYPNLEQGIVYSFDELMRPFSGFLSYGPLLSTSTFKTSCLKNANFKLTEHSPYVDMEFNVFGLKNVETLIYTKLDIYRYFNGRVGQSISPEVRKRNYKKHSNIIFNILQTLADWEDYPADKRRFVTENYISKMVDSQIFLFDLACAWDEIDPFLTRLNKYPGASKAALSYIKKRNSSSQLILENYKSDGYYAEDGPIVAVSGKVRKPKKKASAKRKIKQGVKQVIPYGIIEGRQRNRKKAKDKRNRQKSDQQAWLNN